MHAFLFSCTYMYVDIRLLKSYGLVEVPGNASKPCIVKRKRRLFGQ